MDQKVCERENAVAVRKIDQNFFFKKKKKIDDSTVITLKKQSMKLKRVFFV